MEKTTNTLHLLLLDWEKAFDKVDREGLFQALDRLGVDNKLINLVKMIYKDTKFNVSIDGNTSRWEQQERGIRQGCPLSPYLFLVVMTAMIRDIHFNLREGMARYRIPGATFDEVIYADDTICMGTDTRELNKMLAEIETEGENTECY